MLAKYQRTNTTYNTNIIHMHAGTHCIYDHTVYTRTLTFTESSKNIKCIQCCNMLLRYQHKPSTLVYYRWDNRRSDIKIDKDVKFYRHTRKDNKNKHIKCVFLIALTINIITNRKRKRLEFIVFMKFYENNKN